MHHIKQLNIHQGLKAEAQLHQLITRRFGKDLKKTSDTYALFDFESDDTLVELKTRNVRHNQYATTMIGMNKVAAGLKQINKEVIFVFSFIDGIYYYQLDVNDLPNFTIGIGGTSKRGRDERANYLFIPVNALKKLEPDEPQGGNADELAITTHTD